MLLFIKKIQIFLNFFFLLDIQIDHASSLPNTVHGFKVSDLYIIQSKIFGFLKAVITIPTDKFYINGQTVLFCKKLNKYVFSNIRPLRRLKTLSSKVN